MGDRNSIRRAYDEIAETYAAERSDGGREMEILDEFLAPLSDGPRVLDAGCGQGTPVLRRVDAAATGIGIDFSRRQLGLAAANVPGAPLLQADVTQLPLADDGIDAIVAFHTLIHVPTEDQRAAITEFSRILRPGGRLLLSEGPAAWAGTNPDWLDSGVEMQWHIDGVDATRTQLSDAGFEIGDEWEVDEDGDEHWVFLAAQLDG